MSDERVPAGDLGPAVVSALSPLPAGYQALLARAVEVWRGDERVEAVWLSGSLAKGTADSASDLDLVVTATPGGVASFADDWPTWRGAITDTVLARQVGRLRVWTMVTPDWLRWDVVLESSEECLREVVAARLAVWDPTGLASRIPVPRPPEGPNPDRVAALIEEWFRVTAMPDVILTRHDWLLAGEHVHYLRDLLYRLGVEAGAPHPPSGVKRWSSRITPDVRAALERLPATASSAESLEAAHLAISRVFLVTAEALAHRLQIPWPAALEAAAARRLRAVWGMMDPYPRDSGHKE